MPLQGTSYVLTHFTALLCNTLPEEEKGLQPRAFQEEARTNNSCSPAVCFSCDVWSLVVIWVTQHSSTSSLLFLVATGVMPWMVTSRKLLSTVLVAVKRWKKLLAHQAWSTHTNFTSSRSCCSTTDKSKKHSLQLTKPLVFCHAIMGGAIQMSKNWVRWNAVLLLRVVTPGTTARDSRAIII